MSQASETTATPQRIRTYAEFWPVYLREHLDVRCRALHYIGSTLGLICLFQVIATGNLLWLLAGIVAGYGCAWIGHFAFEHNKPATFKYPFWSFVSDWRMYFTWLTGRLGPQLEDARRLPALG